MDKAFILSALAAACVAALPLTHAQDEAPAAKPSLGKLLKKSKKNVDEGNVQAYLQAEREILDLINFDDEEEAANNAAQLKEAILKFRKAYPRPLSAAAPMDKPCPEWMLKALNEEHAMLMELLSKSRVIDEETRKKFPEMTEACKAIYEPMLLSHAILLAQENVALKAYAAAPTLENAKGVMAHSLALTDQENFFYRIGFVAGIFKSHPDKLDELLTAVAANGEDSLGAGAISEALWLLNTPDSIAARLAWPSMVSDACEHPQPDFHKIQDIRNNAEESNLLDCAWGYYDATKDEEVLKSFILCGARAQAPESGISLWVVPETAERTPIPEEIGDVIALTARWSVRSRASQDPAFAEKVNTILSTLSAEEQERFNAPLPEGPGEEQYQQN